MDEPSIEKPDSELLPDRGLWESLVEDFRALGGVVENVVLRPSPAGRGLFSDNPEQPVLLRVPKNLQFRPADIALDGDNIRIREGVRTEQREKGFFECYQTALSWGDGGRTESARLIDMFDSLPPDLQDRLSTDFGMKPFVAGDGRKRTLRYFLRNRGIRRSRETRFAPFLDLMNRSSNGLAATFGPEGWVQISGRATGEIFLRYEHEDSLGTFNKHALAERREHAFSLPLRTKAGPLELVIGRNPAAASTQRPGFRAPQMREESDTVRLSYLSVGNANFPQMPRGIFYVLMREAHAARPEGIFDRILFVNRSKFLALLEALEPLRGELVSRLRRMAHFQLAALAECVGARKL